MSGVPTEWEPGAELLAELAEIGWRLPWREDDTEVSFILRAAVASGALIPAARVQELVEAVAELVKADAAIAKGYTAADLRWDSAFAALLNARDAVVAEFPEAP